MPKAPPPARVGRRQADPPPTPDAPAQAKTGPRAIPLALLVPIDQIEPDPAQPRRDHGAESLAALADSLTAYGVLQPLLVREGDEGEDGRARYRIIAGGRRYAAALLAGLTRLPVVVRDTEGTTLRMTQLVENIQRQALAPLEEARAFQELMDAEGLNAEGLATLLHISGQQIRERLRLLSDQVLADAVERKQIAPSVARAVQRLPVVAQEPLRARIKAGETLPLAEVHEVKERTAAAGVTKVPLGPAEIDERSSEQVLSVSQNRAVREVLRPADGRRRPMRPATPMVFRPKHIISAQPNGTRSRPTMWTTRPWSRS